MLHFILLLSTAFSTSLFGFDFSIVQKVSTQDGREFVVENIPENDAALDGFAETNGVNPSENRIGTLNLVLRDSATDKLHSMSLLHTDMKPENILVLDDALCV
jgi:serine/threonine protein kinase